MPSDLPRRVILDVSKFPAAVSRLRFRPLSLIVLPPTRLMLFSLLVIWPLTLVPDIVCLQERHCSSDLECQTLFRGQRMPVAVLFYFGQLCPLYSLGLNLMEDF